MGQKRNQKGSQKISWGNSLAVQWLGLHASTAGGMGSIPGHGTKILQVVQYGKKNLETKQNKKMETQHTKTYGMYWK